MLTGLTEIAVRIATFLTDLAGPRPEGPRGPCVAFRFRGDPLLAFVRIFRAARLAISLSVRIEKEIDDLRAGKPLGPGSLFSQATQGEAEPMAELSEAVRQGPSAGESEPEAGDAPERAETLMSEFHRGLREDPAFYRLLNGPLKDAIAAICAELGLKPDWSLWSEEGFPAPHGGAAEDWFAFFAPNDDAGASSPTAAGPPAAAPRAGVRDPHHRLEPPRRDRDTFLDAHRIKPRPPPPA